MMTMIMMMMMVVVVMVVVCSTWHPDYIKPRESLYIS
jgi:hypothetical protein